MVDREQGIAFYARIDAHDTLLRLILFLYQQQEPQFAEFVRKVLDTGLGTLAAQSYANPDPLAVEIPAKMRETIREMLANAENAATELRRIAASVRKPPSVRRRIFNWFQRG